MRALRASLILTSGFEAGYWIYNKGLSDDIAQNHLGWDRTHLALFLPAEISTNVSIGNWGVGVALGAKLFFDNTMVAQGHSSPNRGIYEISDNSFIRLWLCGVILRYNLIRKSNFAFGFFAEPGIFFSNDNHPRREQFGIRYFSETGFEVTYSKWAHFGLTGRVNYFSGHIVVNGPEAHKYERINIYSLGMDAGVCWLFGGS